MATYTVKPGDCLWSIAAATLKDGTRWPEIRDLNKTNPKYSSLKNSTIIQPGWELEIPGGSSTTKKTTAMSEAVVQFLGPFASDTSTRTLFLKWEWNRTQTEKYLIEWIYTVDGGHTLYDTSSVNVDEQYDSAVSKQIEWSIPDGAKTIKVKVKPIAKETTKNNVTTTPWKVGWSTISSKAMFFTSWYPPDAPEKPNVSVDGDYITATLSNLDADYAEKLHFQVWANHSRVHASSENVKIKNGHASYKCKMTPGNTYTVRCRAYKRGQWSEFSLYTDEIVARPIAPTKLTAKALSENDVRLSWKSVSGVTGYEYQYATNKEYFETAPSQVTSGNVEDKTATIIDIFDLETGNFTYFFRLRAVGSGGESDWSNITSVTLGKAPAAPTTWSSVTNAVIGNPVKLYWVHNSEDGSSQTYAKLELTINGKTSDPIVIPNTTSEEDRDNTSEYTLDTSAYAEDTQILWRVCTAGVLVNEYGDWSVQRSIDIYEEPELNLSVTKTLDGDALDTLESFPFYVTANADTKSQTPIGYHLKVIANESYETVDNVGNPKRISAGDAVYSKHFDCNFEVMGLEDTSLYVEFSPDNIDLENNISYTLICTVAMDSGLSAEESVDFPVAWEDVEYIPNAEIGYDSETYSAIIRPYCEDVDGVLIDGVVLSVYRRDYDGKFTEIMSNVPNNGYTFVTDPHPALDYARYRIVATVEATGAISYYDIPGYPINECGIIIQWDETWSEFDSAGEETLAERPWVGSLVRLPFNVDVSSEVNKDVTTVEYIGREHPVSYYGTQLGEGGSWKAVIRSDDIETKHALRRLSVWMGNAYVRAPSGVGYWANVSVRFSEEGRALTIPVTIDVTRVEGGM